MLRWLVLCALWLGAQGWLTSVAEAGQEPPIAVQGVLRTAQGGPASDGTYALTLALYDSKDAAKPLWTEIHVAVVVQNGWFQLQMGQKDADKPLTIQHLLGDERWLGVTVGGDPELSRTRIGTVPYAMVASRALVADALAAPLPGGALAAESVGPDQVNFAFAAADSKGGAAMTALKLLCTGCIGGVHLADKSIPATKLQMGKGSGLDAELLDGLPGSAYLKKSDALPDALVLSGEGQVDDGVPAWQLIRAPEGGSFSKAVLDVFALRYIVPISQALGFVESSDSDFADGIADSAVIEGAGTDAAVALATLAGDGADGALTVGSGVTTINQTATRASGIAGLKTLKVTATTGWTKGAHLLLHQSQGKGAGTWEMAVIASVDGATQMTLAAPLQQTYSDSGGDVAQAVLVPRYTDVTVAVGATLTAPAWNGSTGGILALRATGKVTIQGKVDMSGRGFRGGKAAVSGSDYVFNGQGEGTAGPGAKAAEANGNGGGAGCGQASGAGGGHGTAGTVGELSGCHCGGVPQGGSEAGDAKLAKMLMGGGGGASGSHGGGGRNGADGGAGGGIVWISAKSVEGAGSWTADGSGGQDGYLAGGSNQPMGGGGGGAGGSIRVATETLTSGGTLSAQGGKGGANNTQGSCSPSGKGGGGAPGRLYLTGSTVVAAATLPKATVDLANPGGVATGTYASDIKDTVLVGARLNRVEWSAVTPQGTALQVQVRAADAAFAPQAVQPAWVEVAKSGGDPALKGRFVQYRAVLSGSATVTPKLFDVSLSVQGTTQLTTLPKGVALQLGNQPVQVTAPNPAAELDAVVGKLDITKALNEALATGKGLTTLQLSATQAGRLQWALWLTR
jgi:hypothetical protein